MLFVCTASEVITSVAVRSIAMSVYVRLSVCSHTLKTTCPNFTKFSAYVTCGRGSVSSDDNAISYVLLDLPMKGYLARE